MGLWVLNITSRPWSSGLLCYLATPDVRTVLVIFGWTARSVAPDQDRVVS